jgi:hypothetical protein
VWRTFMVNGNGDGSCSSSAFGVVDGGGLLRPQCSLASVPLSHLGVEGCLLTTELIVGLSHPHSTSIYRARAHACCSSW